MAYDATAVSHQEWLGYVQPVGVVVSTPALLEAGAAINRNFVPLYKEFLAVLPQESDGTPILKLTDFPKFATGVLGWRPQDLEGPDESLTIAVPGYEEILHPDYVVKDAGCLLLLVCKTGADFDTVPPPEPRHWHASPQAKFERLLRETGVPSGLLVSPDAIRLVYAPKGESSGHITFKIADMAQVAGRPILAALHMLLSAERLFTLAQDQRLPALLIASRKHQNVVSNKLSGQVMEALFDLLRGFQSAHDQTGVLTEVLRDDPNQVYAGLLTVLLRLVFILYAEDRDLLSSDETFINSYSVGGLFERLREDEAHHPDTMDQRYGAWARLVVLFRLIYKGARHAKLNIPGRKGYLFDPDRYPFLEGRPNAKTEEIQMPRVPDGVLYRVLRQLLILDGERLSYRNLDVEQIGSVYEAMMGFELHVAKGPSIALKPKKRNGAPITINLAEALAVVGSKRNDWLKKEADQKLTGQAERALKEASSIDDLMAALDRRIAKNVTPTIVPAEAMIFQPSAERRRSGSHYTPRSLTQPIVEAALAPVLKNLGENPKPEQILALKVCDPAMGSGAFLVEACRQLGDALVAAWDRHDQTPIPPHLPPDEDVVLHARRLVAQRCLYGVDRNVMAVDLAKLSLWLATLARDHEFTFLDHSLRHGDSLVGYSAKQSAAFHWEPPAKETFILERVRRDIASVAEGRRKILNAQDGTPYAQLSQELGKVEEKLQIARNLGDVLVSAFFSGKNARTRENARQVFLHDVDLAFGNRPDTKAGLRLDSVGAQLRARAKPVTPFHWELEFPEVFALDRDLRAERGFNAIVGNPPFYGGTKISEGHGMDYFAWLTGNYAPAGHLCDLVGYFFRRSFSLLREGGCLGLIATNTIAQGDTREGSLLPILRSGGSIYAAQVRLRWPGEAAVIVSRLHVAKAFAVNPVLLNGSPVDRISAFLIAGDVDESPERLVGSPYFSLGSKIYGQGFLFDDKDPEANPDALRLEVIRANPECASRIFPYIGGEDLNSSPTQVAPRYVIFLSDIKSETELAPWPELEAIVRRRVKPGRDVLGDNPNNVPLKRLWWAYQAHRPELYERIKSASKVLANSSVSGHLSFAFLPTNYIYSQKLTVFDISSFPAFCVMQSRVHEIWARFLSSTLKDDLSYSPSDCFETFPFPQDYEVNMELEQAGRRYYDFRAKLMFEKDEGLTKTYNRFHRPDERSPEIVELRHLHERMDEAVIRAYRWDELLLTCEFFPEFDEEDNDDSSQPSRPRPAKYRLRWPEKLHDDVLARLLSLNVERATIQGSKVNLATAGPVRVPRKRIKVDKIDVREPALFE
ncbi:type I restriction-modification system methyltransferase subunit [Terriglobus roseus DSM 18391]|uniref:site-specific DNA-methyltransferase (adenine-specific) n=1 Tax=Terriglobus roseus (strain DSM 18391 / NRRL B-41598 / KBS 63) TaxID=926566 RepID=I3ZJA4_TERRK|nr:DNA methyltransferase [Terriglobus roseus]AFL89322.1 type I restriction-modification system methyltransferase subunit [Terriglobus roseus DSM 18391]